MVAVLDALGLARVDVYGDSYGSFAAQTLALRHPGRVRSLVLDGTYPLDFDPWARDALAVARNALRATATARRPARGARTTPSSASRRSRAACGRVRSRRLRATPAGSPSTCGSTIAASPASSPRPTASSRSTATSRRPRRPTTPATPRRSRGSPRRRSPAAPTGRRRLLLGGARRRRRVPRLPAALPPRGLAGGAARPARGRPAKLPADAFAPFDRSTWFGADLESYDWCVRWPRATHAPDPARPPGAAYPSIPTLVLDGDLDQRTSLIGARRVAAQFPNSTLVPVANQGHVTALVDWYGCAAGIVRRFIATRRASGTACARENPPLHLVAAFPRTSRTAPEATPASGDASFAAQRRAAWCAAQAVADAVARYPLLPGTAGVGLRGGHFSVRHGAYLDHGPVTLRLRGVRFCADVAGLRHRDVAPHERPGARSDRLPDGAREPDLVARDARPRTCAGRSRAAGGAPVALRLTVPAP